MISELITCVCSIECDGTGISAAGIIVLCIVLIIGMAVGCVYLKRRRNHRTNLTEEHAKHVFMALIQGDPTVRQLGARWGRIEGCLI